MGKVVKNVVSAINATQVKVTFNKPLDLVSASKAANYELYAVGSATDRVGTVKLSDDKKSATITLSAGQELTSTATDYTLKIDNVYDDAENEIKDFSKVYSLADTVRPTISDITWEDSQTISFVVSEPVAADGSTTDGVDINDFVAVYNSNGIKEFGFLESAGKAVYNATTGKVTVDVSGLTKGSYTLKVASLKDKAGNLVTSNPTVKTFEISDDKTAPTVSSVKNLGINTDPAGVIEVKFDEKIKADPAGDSSIDYFVVEVDGVADTSAVITTSDDKNFTVELPSVTAKGLHKITLKSYKDLAGNAGADKNQFVTIESSKPAVKSAEFVTTSTGDKVVVKFDRNLTAAAASSLAGLTATYVTSENVEDSVSIDTAAITVEDIDGDDINELVIDADNFDGSSAELPGGSYKISLAGGYVEDVAEQGNAATTITFAVPEESATSQVVVGNGSNGTTAPSQVVDTDNNTVYVTFSDEVGSSALNLANYTVEGEAAFERAVFTSTSKDTVKLTLKADAIGVNGEYTLATKNILDADGHAVKDSTQDVALVENTAPAMAKAEVTANDTILVTFTEGFSNHSSVTGLDFVVKVNGTAVTLATGDASTTAAGVTTITLPAGSLLSSASDVVTITTDSDFDGLDTAIAGGSLTGNKGKVGQTVTATWSAE
ncbi:hypothetical protein [Metabacillus endolithicus]|uniref:SbsA Ig-like domain-containing protein n=1 Tax=Metabacillus endolithicus TaxID=1535204 RepID=A0ABW5BYQ4_9BACI|nr:hypothetical protein [Metabacillus endolithicus]UPG65534.1 hypothetical protein MVE64_11495 [Metabacillus endolithicus]